MLRRMLSRGLARDASGASLIVVAVSFALLLMAVGAVIDVGRYYAVHGKAQNAADAALLGSIATIDTNPPCDDATDSNKLQCEAERIFNANYPAGYMGSHVGAITVVPTLIDTTNHISIYEMTFQVSVPTVIMQYFGQTGTTFNMISQVTRGFDDTKNNGLELAIVVDNTGSMAQAASGDAATPAKIDALKQASRELINILFACSDPPTTDCSSGNAPSSKINVSIVPYETVVNIGSNHRDWMQSADNNVASSQKKYDDIVAITTNANLVGGPEGFAENRQRDHWCGPLFNYCTPPVTCNSPACLAPNAHNCTTQGTDCDYWPDSINPENGQMTPGAPHDKCICTPQAGGCKIMNPHVPLNSSSPSIPNIIPYDIPHNTPPYNQNQPFGYWLQAGCVPFPVDSSPDLQTQGYDYSDITDDPPTSEAARFRLDQEWDSNGWDNNPPSWTWQANPSNYYVNAVGSIHSFVNKLAPILFASNSTDVIYDEIGKLKVGGEPETNTTSYTRIPIGLMWGWFTLSPRWKGSNGWGNSTLPAPFAPTLNKTMILMTDGKNTWSPDGLPVEFGVGNPSGGGPVPSLNGNADNDKNARTYNDDVKTADLCTAIRNQGITIYVVGFGDSTKGELNRNLLMNCASDSSYYFEAPSAADLSNAFHAIADDIIFNTLRLSK